MEAAGSGLAHHVVGVLAQGGESGQQLALEVLHAHKGCHGLPHMVHQAYVSHSMSPPCQPQYVTPTSATVCHPHVSHSTPSPCQPQYVTPTSATVCHPHVSHSTPPPCQSQHATPMSATVCHPHVSHSMPPPCQPQYVTPTSATVRHPHVSHSASSPCRPQYITPMSATVALWVGYRIDPLPCHACCKRRLRQEQLAPRIKGLA